MQQSHLRGTLLLALALILGSEQQPDQVIARPRACRVKEMTG